MVFQLITVPILPDYLSQINDDSMDGLQENLKYKNLYLHYVSTMFNNAVLPNQTSSDKNFEFDITNDKLWNNNKLNDENSSVGILLAVKALIQLITTPFVTSAINSYGYRIPIAFGTFVLLLASFSMFTNFWLTFFWLLISNYVKIYFIAFAVGKSYFFLLMARAMQGVASACISVCGMSIVAQVC